MSLFVSQHSVRLRSLLLQQPPEAKWKSPIYSLRMFKMVLIRRQRGYVNWLCVEIPNYNMRKNERTIEVATNRRKNNHSSYDLLDVEFIFILRRRRWYCGEMICARTALNFHFVRATTPIYVQTKPKKTCRCFFLFVLLLNGKRYYY